MSLDEHTRATTSATSGRAASGRRLLSRLSPGPWNSSAVAVAVVTVLLLGIGLVMSFSASFVDAAAAGDPFVVFRRQLMWALLGVVVFAVAASLDHRLWRRLAWLLLVASIAGLVLVVVPGIGIERYGSTRWLGIGPVTFQPSELAKLASLLWLADVLERKRPRDGGLHTTDHLLVPSLPLLVVLAALVLLQPDLGTAVLIAFIIGIVLWVEGLPPRIVTWLAVTGLVAVTILARVAAYRSARIAGWLRPEADPSGSGFQLLQARYALGSGGVFGLGLGSSRGKWHYVPNPETDFIFAIIGEELGLVGALGVLVLFGALLWYGLHVAYRAADGFGRTVAVAITAWLVGQALINVATVIGLLPITGIPLPLVSVGGSSLVSTLLALGILVAIARGGQGRQPAVADGAGGRA